MATLTKNKALRLNYSLTFKLKLKEGGQSGFVMATLYHSGQRVRFSVGLSRVKIDLWDSANNKPRGDSLQAVELRDSISYVEKVAQQTFEDARQERELARRENRQPAIDSQSLLHNIRETVAPRGGTIERPIGMLKNYDSFTLAYRPKGTNRDLEPRTKLAYGTTRRLISEWFKYRKATLNVADFGMRTPASRIKSEKLASEFHEWLTEKRLDTKGEPKPYNDASAMKVGKTLNTFFGWCEDQGIGGNTKLYRFPIENVEYEANALNQIEVEALESLDLEEGSRTWHVRNLFVLACHTGLRYCDWGSIKPELWRLPQQTVLNRKTKTSSIIVHRDVVRRILKLYEKTGMPNLATNTNYSAKLNDWLKQISKTAGLVRLVKSDGQKQGRTTVSYSPLHDTISTKMGRSTFITIHLRNGVSRDFVKMQTGHKGDKSFKRYDATTPDDIANLYGVVEVMEGVL